MFQLLIDRAVDPVVITETVRAWMPETLPVRLHADVSEWAAAQNEEIGVVVHPLSRTYPALIEVWLPGPAATGEEQRFAAHFARTTGISPVISDDTNNPFRWWRVTADGNIETIYLTDTDLGEDEDDA